MVAVGDIKLLGIEVHDVSVYSQTFRHVLKNTFKPGTRKSHVCTDACTGVIALQMCGKQPLMWAEDHLCGYITVFASVNDGSEHLKFCSKVLKVRKLVHSCLQLHFQACRLRHEAIVSPARCQEVCGGKICHHFPLIIGSAEADVSSTGRKHAI